MDFMILPGHLAAGYLAAHYAKLDEKVALVAAVFPDVVDKTCRYVLHLTPNGRIPMHSLIGLLLTTGLIWLILRRQRIALAWAAGYGSHLMADVLTDVLQYGGRLEYLAWPFARGQVSQYTTLFGSVLDYVIWVFLAEGLVCVWALVIFWRGRRRERAAASS